MSAKSISEQILAKNNNEPIAYTEYENLILDEMHIPCNSISSEDKAYLEQFTECTNLSLNNCGLKDLENLPKIAKLTRLELCDNKIGTLPSDLVKGLEDLATLKLAGNEIASLDALEPLKALKKLRCLDLDGCPIQDKCEDYKTKLFEMFGTQLEVLDGRDKEGNSVPSDDDDDLSDDMEEPENGMEEELEDEEDMLDEEGEAEMSDEDDAEVQIGADATAPKDTKVTAGKSADKTAEETCIREVQLEPLASTKSQVAQKVEKFPQVQQIINQHRLIHQIRNGHVKLIKIWPNFIV